MRTPAPLVIALALALAAPAAGASPPVASHPWVLLGLDMGMGTVEARRDVPSFDTRAKCQAALNREIRRHSGLTHAEGNLGIYACSDLRSWEQGS
jgi:hypothetical protein